VNRWEVVWTIVLTAVSLDRTPAQVGEDLEVEQAPLSKDTSQPRIEYVIVDLLTHGG
jgi:hypothetical protein